MSMFVHSESGSALVYGQPSTVVLQSAVSTRRVPADGVVKEKDEGQRRNGRRWISHGSSASVQLRETKRSP